MAVKEALASIVGAEYVSDERTRPENGTLVGPTDSLSGIGQHWSLLPQK